MWRRGSAAFQCHRLCADFSAGSGLHAALVKTQETPSGAAPFPPRQSKAMKNRRWWRLTRGLERSAISSRLVRELVRSAKLTNVEQRTLCVGMYMSDAQARCFPHGLRGMDHLDIPSKQHAKHPASLLSTCPLSLAHLRPVSCLAFPTSSPIHH